MFEELYAQNRGLLYALANRWRGACERDRAVSVDDLAQAGFFGLVKAAESFDPGAGKAWTGWATWHIVREFENALCLRDGRPLRPQTSAVSLDAPISEDAEGATLGDLLEDETLPETDEGLLRDELRQAVREAVAGLSDGEQRRAVQLHDLEGKSSREAAEALGMHVQGFYNLRQRAHAALRRDKRLRALATDADLDELTRFYAHKGLAAFERDWTSVTEGAALWRVEQREKRQP